MFSAGYDIGGLPNDEFAHRAESLVAHPFHDAIAALEAFPYPAVAALNGHAIGGGLELALTCDLRMAATGAKLGMPPAKLGLVYSHTGLRKFIDAIGVTRTRDLFFTGRNVSAATALEWGMVTEIAPPEKLAERAVAYAAEIAANAPLSLAGNKRVITELLAAEGAARPRRSRRSSSRCARPASAARTSTKACARSPRSGPPNGRGGKRRRSSSRRWRCRGAAGPCARGGRPRARRPAPRGVVRLRHLGPGAQADAEPRLAPLGHAQARRHHRARAARVPRRPPGRAARAGRRPLAPPRRLLRPPLRRARPPVSTRTGSTSTSTTPASTASSERRGARIRSTAWPPRSSSTASSRSARSRSTSARTSA